jgi:hypothetical protein
MLALSNIKTYRDWLIIRIEGKMRFDQFETMECMYICTE